MLAKPRVVLALSCLAGGVFMAPFIPLATDTVDWQAMADAFPTRSHASRARSASACPRLRWPRARAG